MGWQLFPTGIGWREFSATKSEGNFACPNLQCRGRATEAQQYRLRRARNWFTLLFVPVIPLNVRGFYVECRHCKSIFSVEVLRDVTPAAVASTESAGNVVANPPRSRPPSDTPAAPQPEPASTIGWYPDPFARHRYRYWDGRSWTDQVADGGVVAAEAPGFAPPSSPDPAWIVDPAGRHRYRYWDGTHWTDQVADGGVPSTDPVAPPPPNPAIEPSSGGEPSPLPPARVDVDSTTPRDLLNLATHEPSPVVALGDGTHLDLSRPIVFGRNPIATDGYADATLRQLDDLTVSKTHAVIGFDGDRVWVVDLQSRNGVTLASNPDRPLVPGHRHSVDVGDTIVLGDSTTVHVKPSPGA